MKRFFVCAVSLVLVLCLTGCGFIHFMPTAEEIGESKTFQKEGITLLLTDAYGEQVSERGFYAYYVADFGAVMVERIALDEDPAYQNMSLTEFAETYKKNNGHGDDVTLQRDEELLYYENESGNRTYFVFFYQGAEAFWTVQFACYTVDEIVLKSTIFLCAHAVDVE